MVAAFDRWNRYRLESIIADGKSDGRPARASMEGTMSDASRASSRRWRTGVIMDPIAGIATYKDSTFAMLLEAQRRERRIVLTLPAILRAGPGEPFGIAALGNPSRAHVRHALQKIDHYLGVAERARGVVDGNGGVFLDADQNAALFALADEDASREVPWQEFGAVTEVPDAIDAHIARVLDIPFLDIEAIRARQANPWVHNPCMMGLSNPERLANSGSTCR